jgi:hypothetical protein
MLMKPPSIHLSHQVLTDKLPAPHRSVSEIHLEVLGEEMFAPVN